MAEKVAARITKRTARMTLVNPSPKRNVVFLDRGFRVFKITNPRRECQLILKAGNPPENRGADFPDGKDLALAESAGDDFGLREEKKGAAAMERSWKDRVERVRTFQSGCLTSEFNPDNFPFPLLGFDFSRDLRPFHDHEFRAENIP